MCKQEVKPTHVVMPTICGHWGSPAWMGVVPSVLPLHVGSVLRPCGEGVLLPRSSARWWLCQQPPESLVAFGWLCRQLPGNLVACGWLCQQLPGSLVACGWLFQQLPGSLVACGWLCQQLPGSLVACACGVLCQRVLWRVRLVCCASHHSTRWTKPSRLQIACGWCAVLCQAALGSLVKGNRIADAVSPS